MYRSHKIIPHTIKRAIQSQCFIDPYCPATVTAESQGTDSRGVGLYGYGPGLAEKLLPIVPCWQDAWMKTISFNASNKTRHAC